MRLPASLVLPLLLGAVQAASETAKVYILQKPEFATSSTIPTLTPEEASLVIAQRLGTSQRYSLSDVSDDALAHINAFGGPQKQLFTNDDQDLRSQLLIVIDNATPEAAAQYQKLWAPIKPVFEISNPPSTTANERLISDSTEEEPFKEIRPECRITYSDVPSNKRCWPGKSKIMQFSAASGEPSGSPIDKIREILFIMKYEAVDVMIILMPESRHHYNLYDKPARPHWVRSAQFEEPIEEVETTPVQDSNIFKQAKGKKNATVIYSTCYPTNETCQSATGNCSGHGQCQMRYGSKADNESEADSESCYTCGCVPSINITKADDGTELARRTYWGGAACQKEDVSSPFWLLLGVTVVLMGIVSAGIGMLFSIGEEKLPSVIGAGVSAPKAR